MTNQIDGKAVERFEPEYGSDSVMRYFAFMRETLGGRYVRSSDFDALLSERDALQAQLSAALAREGAVAMEVRDE